jgi:hypothetical protein
MPRNNYWQVFVIFGNAKQLLDLNHREKSFREIEKRRNLGNNFPPDSKPFLKCSLLLNNY